MRQQPIEMPCRCRVSSSRLPLRRSSRACRSARSSVATRARRARRDRRICDATLLPLAVRQHRERRRCRRPGASIELDTRRVAARDRPRRRRSDRWPEIIAAPPILQLRPMRVAAGDADAAGDRRVRADPQLWPIWIWLSSLTSSSITVSSIAPRSIVVLAPISHVVADHHAADLRDLEPAAGLLRHAEAVGADHRAAVDDACARRRRSAA